MMPWLLIVIGLIFLLENLNIIPGINWSIIWPVLLICAGLYMMKKRGGDSCCGWHGETKEEKK